MSLANAVATLSTERLQGLRRRLEPVLFMRFSTGSGRGTQADLRSVAVLDAVGVELLKRHEHQWKTDGQPGIAWTVSCQCGEWRTVAPIVATHENGQRLSAPVLVF